MRVLVWIFRLVLFLLLFAFAAKNTEPVTVRFFFSTIWQAPLIVVLLAFFGGGVLIGVLAMTPPFVRQWRARRKLQGQQSLDQKAKLAAAPTIEPPRTGV